MLKAMIAGETDAEKLAALGHERLGCTRAELVEVLTGRVREHHRFLLGQHLRTIEQLKDSVAAFDARIEAALSPFHDIVERVAPRVDESAGKHRSTRIRKGAPWLKPVLVQAAWGAARKKNSYFQAQFLRLKARHGAKKAAIAVAASILTTVYHMLRDGTCYQDLGPEYFTRRNPAQAAARLANRIRNLGYHVEIRAAA